MITYSTSNHMDDGLLIWLDLPDGNRVLLGNIRDDEEDLEAIKDALDRLVSYYPDGEDAA